MSATRLVVPVTGPHVWAGRDFELHLANVIVLIYHLNPVGRHNMAQETLTKVPKTGGDDLDDGLELDPELLASESEDDGEINLDEDDGEEGVYEGDDLSGDEDGERERATGVGKKRKAEVDDERELGGNEDGNEEARKADKKRRKKEKEKARKAKVSRARGRCLPESASTVGAADVGWRS
jgi:protein CMS1